MPRIQRHQDRKDKNNEKFEGITGIENIDLKGMVIEESPISVIAAAKRNSIN